MAEHEGWYVKANVDISGLLQANQETVKLLGNLKKVDAGFTGLHPNDSLARSIKSSDIATASYIERLKSSGKTYEADKEQAKLYEEQIGRLNDRQKELVSGLNDIAEKSGKTSDAYQIQKARINQTATAINGFKKDLQATQADMEKTKPTAFNRITQGASKAVQAGDKMKETLRNGWDRIKGGAVSAAVGVGTLTAAAFKGAKESANLQQRYREISNLAVLGGEKSRNVAKSVAEMQRQGRDISIKYGQSQQGIAEGYEDLVKRGYTTKQALGALKTEVQASVASGDHFSDVTTVSSQVLDAFGKRANSTSKMIKNTKEVVNELAYSADATSTGFNDLGTAMSYVGTAAKANRMSLAETASALGVLSNNGLESDKAGTALRGTINGLTNQINKIGKKNSIFDQLGIKKSEMLDAHGNLKSLATDMGVLYKHIQEHSHGGSEQNGFFKSIFGTSSMNGAEILAKEAREVESLTKRTEKAGKTGTYVARLAARNMGTAQGAEASAKRALDVFIMTIGSAMLPAINQASNSLAKFLLSKDGKKFQKNVGDAVGKVAKQFVNFVKWASTHQGTLKRIGASILAGYSISKGNDFLKFLRDLRDNIKDLQATGGFKSFNDTLGKLNIFKPAGKRNEVEGAASVIEAGKDIKAPGLLRTKLNNAKATIKDIPAMLPGYDFISNSRLLHPIRTIKSSTLAERASDAYSSARKTRVGSHMLGGLESLRKAGGFRNLSTMGKLTTSLTGIGIAASSGYDIYRAIKSKTKKARFTNLGKGIGSAIGGGIGMYFGGPGGAMIGASLGKIAGGWAGRMIKGFGKSKFGKAIGRTFRNTWRDVSKAAGSGIRSVMRQLHSLNHSWGGSFKSMNKATKPLQNFLKSALVATIRLLARVIGSTLVRAIKIAVGIIKVFSSTFKAIRSIVTGVVKVVSDIINGKWSKAWKDFTKYGGQAIKNFVSAIKGLWSIVKNTFGWIGDTVKNVWKFISGKDWHVSKPAAKVKASEVRHAHAGATAANAPAMAAYASGNALVGEAGPELAYRPWTKKARILGAKGPQIARVRPGEHILNARDTRKVMAGGLGRGLVLHGYAAGTARVAKTAKSVTGDYKKITDQSTKQLNKLSKNNRSTWSKVNTDATKRIRSLQSKSRSTWAKITSQTGTQTDKTRKNTVSDYANMASKVNKQMDNLHDGVIKTARGTAKGYGGAMDKMTGYTKNAMSDTIDQINKGTKGIDKVLSQFGGNGEVIKPVHFASGTGALNRNTLAILNDATIGPRQEAVVRGNNLLIPHGKDRLFPLRKNDAVLNGTQALELAHAWGLPHFAKGSGVSHSQLRKIASRGQSNPAKSFADMFTSNLAAKGTDLAKGAVDLGKNSGRHFGVSWTNAMWTVINDAIGGASGKGGTREAFLRYAESTFHGVRYRMGAASKALSDCSGMVMQALRHFGINIGRTTVAMQSSSGVQYLGKSLSKTLPGDLVIFGHGTGAAGHVGIIKNPKTGTMFNETPPYARVTNIADDKGMGYGYYRVRGLHNAAKTSKVAKADKRLEALAKQELGHSAISWIKKHLSEDSLGSLGSFSIGGDIADRARILAKALRKLDPRATKNGIAAILGNWEFESGLNPGAINPGGGASGLGQWTSAGGRKERLIAYARRHGMSWHNAGAQLSFALKGDTGNTGILRSILESHGSISSLANRFSNEWERGGYNAEHVAGAEKIRRALGYAHGGDPVTGDLVKVGEHGPELAQFKQPVHIYDHEESKRKMGQLRRVNMPSRRPQLTVNINFNGNIGGTDKDMRRVANIAKRQVVRAFEDLLNHGEGADPSMY